MVALIPVVDRIMMKHGPYLIETTRCCYLMEVEHPHLTTLVLWEAEGRRLDVDV